LHAEVALVANAHHGAHFGAQAVDRGAHIHQFERETVGIVEIAGQFQADAQAAAGPVGLAGANQHAALAVGIGDVGVDPRQVAAPIQHVGRAAHLRQGRGRAFGQAGLGHQRLRIDAAIGARFKPCQRQGAVGQRGRREPVLFEQGVLLRVDRQRRQARRQCARGAFARVDRAGGVGEVEKADTGKVGRDQDVLRLHLLERALDILFGQDVEHLLGHAERAAELLFGRQRRADIDRDDNVGAQLVRRADRQVAY
jgi:hypothetical protein